MWPLSTTPTKHAEEKFGTSNGCAHARPAKMSLKGHWYSHSMRQCYCCRGQSRLAAGVPQDTSHNVLSPLLQNRGWLMPPLTPRACFAFMITLRRAKWTPDAPRKTEHGRSEAMYLHPRPPVERATLDPVLTLPRCVLLMNPLSNRPNCSTVLFAPVMAL